MSEEEKKEAIRAKKAWYNAQEHMKEKRRVASRAKSHANKIVTTEARLQAHTLDELMAFAKKKCIIANIDWDANKEQFRTVFTILRGCENT